LFDVWCQLFGYAGCYALPADDFRFWGATSLVVATLIVATYLVMIRRLA
jgi:hypothetical protein